MSYNVSNAFNSTNIFALCYDRLLKKKREQIIEIVWTLVIYGTTLSPIDLLGYFKPGFGF